MYHFTYRTIYSQSRDGTPNRSATETAPHAQALILDPVYLGKAMAGFLGRVIGACVA